MTSEDGAKETEPISASNSEAETVVPKEDTDMASADADLPIKEADSKTDSPTKTNYQMSVKTDEKSAEVSDSQAGNASTHEATTEVKAAAQVEEGETAGSPGDVGKLDVHLTYLWEVHRVNFYVGGNVPCQQPVSSLGHAYLTAYPSDTVQFLQIGKFQYVLHPAMVRRCLGVVQAPC